MSHQGEGRRGSFITNWKLYFQLILRLFIITYETMCFHTLHRTAKELEWQTLFGNVECK